MTWIRRLPRGAPMSPSSPWPRSWSHMPLSTPGATARGAGVGDPHPLAATGRAGRGHLEEAPRLDDLAPAAAVVAGGRGGPLARAGAPAFPAEVLAADLDLPARAPGGLDQLDLQL